MPEPVCLPVSKNTLLAKSQEKKVSCIILLFYILELLIFIKD